MTALRHALLLVTLALLAACGDRSSGTATAETGAEANATALTEPQVRAFVEKVEAATGTEVDREFTAAALADEARVTWNTPGQPPESLDKAAFLADIGRMDETIVDDDYSSRVGTVRVAPDGKSATADVAVTHAYAFDGSRYEEASDQVYSIELRDGQPKVVALQATVTSLSIDGEKQF